MKNSHLIAKIFLHFFLMSIQAWSAASPFSASVDRTSIEPGSSLSLTLEMVGDTSDTPHLAALKRDFDILSQSNSSETQYINGRRSAKKSWTLEISPKSDDKTVTIPALRLGPYHSQPITITQRQSVHGTRSDRNIQLRAWVDAKTAYIKQQIILTVELKTSLPLQHATLEKPALSDAIIESLGEDESDTVIEDGIKIQKFTQRHLIFVTKPGRVIIPSIKFEGTVMRRGGRQGFFGNFSSGQRIRAKSDPIEIVIKDIPSNYPKDQEFLPLKSFIISESFDAGGETFKVSKATTRKFELRALGTLASFLPTVATPNIDNVQVYAEAGEKVQKSTADGIEASLTLSHVFIPLAPQKLLVPKQEIYWWDTINEQVKTVSIRALEADVTGQAVITPPSENTVKPVQPIAEVPTPSAPTSFLWPALALSFLALWLLTIVYFMARSKRLQNTPILVKNSSEAECRILIKNIVQAIEKNAPKDVLKQMQALKNFCQTHPEQSPLLNEGFFENLENLESLLYQKSKPETKDSLLNEIKAQVLSMKTEKKEDDNLKTLYPN